MTSYVKRVGDLTDPENFEKAVAEANKNGELDNFDVSKLTSCDINGSTINPCGYDPVTKPSHYAGHTGIDCKAAMESMLGTEAYVSHMQACAFKYLWRWKDKNGVEDLKKARECIGNMLDALECDRS